MFCRAYQDTHQHQAEFSQKDRLKRIIKGLLAKDKCKGTPKDLAFKIDEVSPAFLRDLHKSKQQNRCKRITLISLAAFTLLAASLVGYSFFLENRVGESRELLTHHWLYNQQECQRIGGVFTGQLDVPKIWACNAMLGSWEKGLEMPEQRMILAPDSYAESQWKEVIQSKKSCLLHDRSIWHLHYHVNDSMSRNHGCSHLVKDANRDEVLTEMKTKSLPRQLTVA